MLLFWTAYDINNKLILFKNPPNCISVALAAWEACGRWTTALASGWDTNVLAGWDGYEAADVAERELAIRTAVYHYPSFVAIGGARWRDGRIWCWTGGRRSFGLMDVGHAMPPSRVTRRHVMSAECLDLGSGGIDRASSRITLFHMDVVRYL